MTKTVVRNNKSEYGGRSCFVLAGKLFLLSSFRIVLYILWIYIVGGETECLILKDKILHTPLFEGIAFYLQIQGFS